MKDPQTADVLILTPSKGKWIAVTLIGLAFTAIGIVLLVDGESSTLTAVFCIIFFGAVAVVGLLHFVPGANHLRIDAEGFTMRVLFRTHSYRWRDVGPFRPIHAGQKMVGFDLAGPAGRTRAAALSSSIGGTNAALHDSYGLSVEALADLMNERRLRALSGHRT